MASKKQKAAPAAPLTVLQVADQQAKESVTKALNGYDELVAAGQANLDAMTQANTAAVAGAQQLSAEFVAYVKAVQEANIAASKALSAAKTVQEVVQLQGEHLQASVDAAIAKGSEFTGVAVSVANEVIEPLQARSKVAVDKLLTAHAA